MDWKILTCATSKNGLKVFINDKGVSIKTNDGIVTLTHEEVGALRDLLKQ